jgi:hypothetical protein
MTNRQKIFVEKYLTHFNASRAAREAGYKQKSNVAGSNLLKNPEIQNILDKRIKECQIDANEAAFRLQEIVNVSIADFIDIIDSQSVKFNLKKAKEFGVLGAVKRYHFTKEGIICGIELYDKMKALLALAKILRINLYE